MAWFRNVSSSDIAFSIAGLSYTVGYGGTTYIAEKYVDIVVRRGLPLELCEDPNATPAEPIPDYVPFLSELETTAKPKPKAKRTQRRKKRN